MTPAAEAHVPEPEHYAAAVAAVAGQMWPAAAPAWERKLVAEMARLGFTEGGYDLVVPLAVSTLRRHRPEAIGGRTRRRLAARYQVWVVRTIAEQWGHVRAVASAARDSVVCPTALGALAKRQVRNAQHPWN